MTDLTEDDIEIVVAGLDRIEIKVTSDVKQGEALKKQILEALEFYEKFHDKTVRICEIDEYKELKDKAEKCDGTCQPYSMRPTYQVLEAQVKSLESYYEKYCILQEYNDEMTHENENLKEIVQKIRELALDVPMMITYEEFYKITKELGDEK